MKIPINLEKEDIKASRPSFQYKRLLACLIKGGNNLLLPSIKFCLITKSCGWHLLKRMSYRGWLEWRLGDS